MTRQDDHYELLLEVKQDTKDIKSKVSEIDKTLAVNTIALEEHMKRTNILEQMVMPIHEERIANRAIKEYKEENRKDLLYRLKLPVAIVTAVGAVGTLIAWFMDKI